MLAGLPVVLERRELTWNHLSLMTSAWNEQQWRPFLHPLPSYRRSGHLGDCKQHPPTWFLSCRPTHLSDPTRTTLRTRQEGASTRIWISGSLKYHKHKMCMNFVKERAGTSVAWNPSWQSVTRNSQCPFSWPTPFRPQGRCLISYLCSKNRRRLVWRPGLWVLWLRRPLEMMWTIWAVDALG